MARSTAATHEGDLDVFVGAKTEIGRFLAGLASLGADDFHASPEQITWSLVGSPNISGSACRRSRASQPARAYLTR